MCLQYSQLSQAHFSEEMRLVYVAMTRARERLYITTMTRFFKSGEEHKVQPAFWFQRLCSRKDICQV